MASPHSFLPVRPNLSALPPRAADWLATHGARLPADQAEMAAATLIGSPFLANLMEQWPVDSVAALTGDTAKTEGEITDLLADAETASDIASAMKALRQARTRFALLNGLMDITGQWPIMEAAARMSRFADEAVQQATDFLLRQAHIKGDIALPDINNPAQGCGLTILAMGKFGARELNYSSDIDLIILFDHETAPYTGRKSPHEFFVRLAKDLVKLLQERTEDGYVFRVDLRLRPDASMTPLALSMEAATSYYESTGETWERSAMIKARPVAGDLALGQEFLTTIRPFIWRRNLDFAALDDVMNVTRQIRSNRREPTNPPAGLNIKLGRGGIREIEFFAQAQQLIAGGRNQTLRQAPTLAALNALQEEELLEPATNAKLQTAYVALRQLEHRLQMTMDEQTQTLPPQEEALTRLAHFAGFADVSALNSFLENHRTFVRTTFDGFFDAAGLGDDATDNADCTELATKLNYQNPEAVAAMVDRWQAGSYRAFRSPRSRELARDMTQSILETFAAADGGDDALSRFDGFLSHLPTGVQLFALVRAHDWLLDELHAVLSTAPELGLMLEQKPALLDILLDVQSDERVLSPDQAKDDLAFLLNSARSYEEALDFARRWYADHRFLIGVRQIAGRLSAAEAGRALTNCMDATIFCLKTHVESTFTELHGHMPGGSFAILALGKLGARELSATSDIDLIFIYDFDETAKQSDGPKPLSPGHYYQRLGQRMVTALSAPTAEGRVAEVDMRLRPQGQSGPLCTRLTSFASYYGEGGPAWTYELQALLKARVLSAPPALEAAIDATLHNIQTADRDAPTIRADIAAMRTRMDKHFADRDPWSIKQVRGGLVDIEFILQAQALVHGAEEVIDLKNMAAAIQACADHGWLTKEAATLLQEAHSLYTTVQSLRRLCLTGRFAEDELPQAFASLLTRATETASIPALRERLSDLQHRVLTLFEAELGSSNAAPADEALEQNAPPFD